MFALDFSAVTVLAAVVLAVAALGVALAVVGLAPALAGHRRVRLTRHETMRTYYRGLALSH